MSFKKNKYQILKGVISKEIADFAFAYFLNKRKVARFLFCLFFKQKKSGQIFIWSKVHIPFYRILGSVDW